MRLVILITAATLLAFGPAAVAQKALKPPPGPIHVTIKASLDEVKTKLLEVLAARGFSIEQDTQYLMTASKPASGGASFLTQLNFGSNSSLRLSAQFIFAKEADAITVTLNEESTVFMQNGGVRRSPINSNKERAGMQDFLNDLNVDVILAQQAAASQEPRK